MTSDYLIVIDLDGTLLPKNKKIPFLTKRYLRNLIKKGYNIVLASGRPARNIKVFYEQLGLKTPIISLNGIHIHYPSEPNRDERIFYNPEQIKNILGEIKKRFAINNVIFETDKIIYISNKNAYMQANFWLQNMKIVYNDINDSLKNPVMTFIVELKDKNFNDDEVKNIFKNFPHQNVRFWVGAYRGYVEIYEDTNNKYLAIMKLAEQMHIKKENIIAFGDDLNDFEMIANLPHAYAMPNGREETLAVAHHICHIDNEHEGVKKELKTILKHLK